MFLLQRIQYREPRVLATRLTRGFRERDSGNVKLGWVNLRWKELSDEQLMFLYSQGEPKAFDEIYQRFHKRIYGYLIQKLNRSDADELFQIVFSKLHAKRHLYNPKLLFTGWLFAIIRNCLTDHFRKQGRNPLSHSDSQPLEDLAVEQNLTSKVSLSDLSPKQRQALKLRYYEQFSFDEIADRLGTTPGYARHLVSRGIRQLRRLLAF